MFRSLFLFRRLLATSFLVVFVNVFVGQCYCASLSAPKAPATKTRAVAAPAPMKPGHACCRKAAERRDQASRKAQHQKHAGADGCCRQKSATLLASLSSEATKQLLSPAPAVLPATPDFHFPAAPVKWDPTVAVRLVPPQHLPPKIPDIRIFLQSLTV
ncbi:hypothetical protein LJY25_13400 [Hymenobacter sp. BT175]|uniref:hypothetical protein n=1 Tax=Hymenobacter translucens TaxID=2886507 RepID=UPI001D0E8DE4|nr:hypothetical protein [Hymenobacter translucens]MCC2547445.1 hypothetical protein [Hymenobacter translucens]